MPGSAIAPQVVLAVATVSSVLVATAAAEFRAWRAEIRRKAERIEDQKGETRELFHGDRLAASVDLLTAVDRHAQAMGALWIQESKGSDDLPAMVSALESLADARNANARCSILFPQHVRKVAQALVISVNAFEHDDTDEKRRERLRFFTESQQVFRAEVRKYLEPEE